jgi:hypothetical protein
MSGRVEDGIAKRHKERVFRVFFGPLVDMGLWQIINVQDIPIVDPP